MTSKGEINLIVSSDPTQGAFNRSADGSYFEIKLEDNGIQIPKDATQCYLSVEEATVWWVVPNIITGVNDKVFIQGPPGTTSYSITLPQGLYDLNALNSAISTQLENLGATSSPEPIISLSADSASQRVNIRFPFTTSRIDFTQPQTIRDVVGFPSQVVGPFANAPVTVRGSLTPAFNSVNYFLLHCDLSNQGLRFNSQYSQVVSQILIDKVPGSQIISRPQNPPKIAVPELIGATRSSIRVWLTNDKNERVNTNGEYYSARFKLEYY
jgi:hypothetical protein